MNGESDFEAETKALLTAHGGVMLKLAKASIVHGLTERSPLTPDLSTLPPELSHEGACFVTLHLDGQLRGCIGSPTAWRALGQDIAENAFQAAFRDPRFGALRADECSAALNLEISVLSPASPIEIVSEADLLRQLRPHVDGLIIEDKGLRALFLPQVWAQLPEPQSFVTHLKLKAGMDVHHWSDTFKAKRFIAEEVHADWTDIGALD